MVHDDDTGRRNHYELDLEPPGRGSATVHVSDQTFRQIIELADEFGWRSANRIHAALGDASVTVTDVKDVLDRARPGRAREY